MYYEVDYDIILLFGTTELKAQVAWKENVSGLNMLFKSNRHRINITRGF